MAPAIRARPPRRLVSAALLALVGGGVSTARAEPAPSPVAAPVTAPKLTWDPAVPRFRTGEYVATGVLILGTLPAFAIGPKVSPWSGVSSFDEGARDALRLKSGERRDLARDASDLLLTVAVNYPLLIDSIVVAAWYHESTDVAWEMAMIDAEAFALNAALSTWISSVTSRERPYGRLCPDDDALKDEDCAGRTRYRGFFSGHTSTAFTSAGLVCSHHDELELYGGGLPDALACANALAGAVTMGALRVMADQHYVSDVMVGASVGLLSGFGVPYLLHYGARTDARTRGPGDARSSLTLGVLPTPGGAHVIGTF